MKCSRRDFIRLGITVPIGLWLASCGLGGERVPSLRLPTQTPRFQVYSPCLLPDPLDLNKELVAAFGEPNQALETSVKTAFGAEVSVRVFGQDVVRINPNSFAAVLNLAEELRLTQHVLVPAYFQQNPDVYAVDRFINNRRRIGDGSVVAFAPSDSTGCAEGNLAWTLRPEQNPVQDQVVDHSYSVIALRNIENFAGSKDTFILTSCFGVEALQSTVYRETLTAVDESVAHGFGYAIAYVSAWRGGAYGSVGVDTVYSAYHTYCQRAYINHSSWGDIPFAPVTSEFFGRMADSIQEPVIYSWE